MHLKQLQLYTDMIAVINSRQKSQCMCMNMVKNIFNILHDPVIDRISALIDKNDSWYTTHPASDQLFHVNTSGQLHWGQNLTCLVFLNLHVRHQNKYNIFSIVSTSLMLEIIVQSDIIYITGPSYQPATSINIKGIFRLIRIYQRMM